MNQGYARRLTVVALFLVVAMLASTLPVMADDAGDALVFDGVDDVVFVGDTSDVIGANWDSTKTVVLWLKPDGPVQGQTANNIGEFVIGPDRPRTFGINRSNLGDGDKLRVWNSDGRVDTVAVDFTPDEWVHIAMVHANGELAVYRNGALVSAIPSDTTFAPRDGNLWISGGQRTDPASFFGGEIDEVQFWSAALDQPTIQAWMFRELNASHPNWTDLRAYYRMSDGTGLVLSDDSGNGVTGDLRGGMSDDNWIASGAFDGAPDTIAPVADPQSVTTDEDVTLTITLTASDEDEDPLTFQVVSGPSNGMLGGIAPNLTYTPSANFNGVDSFTFVANDGLVDSAPADIDITVASVNDAPEAVDDSVSMEQDTVAVFEVLSNDDDIDGDALTVASAGTASNGVAVANGSTVSYTPNPGFVGSDSFTYVVDDGNDGTDTGTVYVDVLRVNEAPIAYAQGIETDEDLAATITLAGSDGDDDPLTYIIVDGPVNGSLSGTAPNLTYTPGANFYGADSFTFAVNDTFVDSAPAIVDITVNAVNDAPVAVDDLVSLEQDTAAVFDVLGNDTDVENDQLSITSVGAATNGVVVFDSSVVTYTPNAGYVGGDSFTYTVGDGNDGSDTATVTVDVREASPAGFALRFDGSNDFVRVAETANILGPGWESSKSITLWVKPTGVAAVPVRPTPAFCDAVIGDRPRWWGISRCEINGADRLWIWNYDGSFDGLGIPYTPGEWTQIGFVHDGGTITAFKDGVEVGSISSGATLQPNTGAFPVLQYGGVINNADRNWTFEGEIDEVRVWSGARSGAEIGADLLEVLDGTESGLATYHQMSDGEGVIVTDDSVYAWDGELNDGLPPQVPPDGPIEWVESGALRLPSFAAAASTEVVLLRVDDVSMVDVAAVTAQASGESAVVSWVTYSEYYNEGFNIYRAASVDGPYELLTAEMIESGGGDSEAAYQFSDAPGEGTYYYILEDVNDQGVATRQSPVSVTIGGDGPDGGSPLFLPSLQG